MGIRLVTCSILTASDGSFSKAIVASGKLLQYRYVPHASTPLDTGADITVVGDTTGLVFINQTNIGTSAFTKSPRQATHDTAGAASLFAAGGEPVEGFLYAGGEDLTLTVAQGGDTKSGKLYLWFCSE